MKKIFVLLLLPLLLLTGCKAKDDKLFMQQENKVKEDLQDIDKLKEETIKEQYLYLKDNYENYNKDNKEQMIYSAKYIQTIGNEHENDLTKLADLVLVYIKDKNKENFEKLDVMFKNVQPKEDKLISDLYNSYLIDNIVKELIKEKRTIVDADLKDKNLLTKKFIKDGIDYIIKNIDRPFKDNEVLENLVYYSMYFDGLSTKGQIKTLGTKTLSYLQTLDEKTYTEINKILTSMNKDKEIKKVIDKK